MAGPFSSKLDPKYSIPLDKKLDAAWVRSLTERGEPTVYRGWDQLKHIGMPIGGIGCGTVYLGGDGKLWCWDIFNQPHEGCVPKQAASLEEPGQRVKENHGANYIEPTDDQSSPWRFEQGFVLNVDGRSYPLDRQGFSDITFKGQYPIADITYRSPTCPVEVDLEAMTPFIPLKTELSSYPATIMRYTLTNTSNRAVRAKIAGYTANPALRGLSDNHLHRTLGRSATGTGVVGQVKQRPLPGGDAERDDIVFADFEGENWGEWRAKGQAFAGGPFPVNSLSSKQHVSGQQGQRMVNSHNSRRGGNVPAVDNFTGTLTSPEFTISRKYISLLLGGGNRQDDAFFEVLVDGKRVAAATGQQTDKLRLVSLDVSAYEGSKGACPLCRQRPRRLGPCRRRSYCLL